MYVVYLNCLHFIHTEDHDYVCNYDGPGCNYLQVTFYSGQRIATVNITIRHDTEIECNETVNIHISDSRIELMNEVTITIVDDDIGKSLTLYAFYYNKMII